MSESDEQRQKNLIEAIKIKTDYFKHLTTLCTGSIVVSAAFVDKLGSNI
jgi:hypothetical protein